ncbi:EamA family transporter [Tenacibaculum soleae]|uniref:EamA family transporter n=1 Tax=Tenacibaculum soleae TaxID=447689 RepID=UPI002300E707|nr:EamA family transporter [Tenacibaculum soleae]
MIKQTSKSAKTILLVVSFFSIYVFWGSTYLLNKIALQQLPPLTLAATRFITASILIFIIAKYMGLSLKISKIQLLNSVIAGFFFLAYGNGVFVWALKHVDSGFAALEASTQPLIILILMRVFQGRKIQNKSYIGVVLGIIGMYLLVSQKEILYQDDSLLAILMIFSCVLSWSIASLFVAKADLPPNFFVNAGYQMLFGGILLFLASFFFRENWLPFANWNAKTYIAIIGLILFGSIAAFTAFNYLLKVVSTEKVATSALINPIVALFLGWYFLDEKITSQSIIAAILLLTGVYFINKSKK